MICELLTMELQRVHLIAEEQRVLYQQYACRRWIKRRVGQKQLMGKDERRSVSGTHDLQTRISLVNLVGYASGMKTDQPTRDQHARAPATSDSATGGKSHLETVGLSGFVPGPPLDHFLCEHAAVTARIDAIDPDEYARTRNDLDGAVTWLGPFLTHGVTTTKEVAERVRRRHAADACYRLLFELAWREFFHRTWEREGDRIFTDLRTPPPSAMARERHDQLPRAMLDANTGIAVIDRTLAHLAEHGVMHNHARMWTAAIACNLGQTDWRPAARWLHYQLLDGDLASNTLSWQWVAGTFSNKRYFANQTNINRYSGVTQAGTWLDVPYEAFDAFPLPDELRSRGDALMQHAPRGEPLEARPESSGTVALRSLWNLDPRWRMDIDEHIVFIDTDWLARWPLADTRWRFIEHWTDRCGATLHFGTLDDLRKLAKTTPLLRQEYPACNDWPGHVEQRPWLFPAPSKPFPSFTRFWKQVSSSAGL